MLVSLVFAIPQAKNAEATLKATEAQAENLRQQQLTDRFSKAIEQLGTRDNLDVRLGGIYALERIARDSPDDQPAMVNVLTAFVRETTKRDPQGRCPNQPPTVDVQAALTVVTHRNPRDNDPRIDLSNVCLAQVDLKRAYLRYAYLAGANLRGADLRGANLETTSFDNADLRGAYLQGGGYADIAGDARYAVAPTNLLAASFRGADLTGAYLGGAYLRNAFFNGANLTGAHFTGADLTVADFTGADLSGTSLTCTPARDETGVEFALFCR
ncbi:pentapeptide repeat-containing protein [Amycolatopsis rhizosphaerae]|uniref:pentapeptide repeat-containing protein n=1 Tax=Amycolatopsis rhizosphaerae TaxID=2053003 RepID=UPI0016437B49|nr:pentapeptide repeat-containing protein [Amycolatopsis rhizosphaerae]